MNDEDNCVSAFIQGCTRIFIAWTPEHFREYSLSTCVSVFPAIATQGCASIWRGRCNWCLELVAYMLPLYIWVSCRYVRLSLNVGCNHVCMKIIGKFTSCVL